MHFRKDSDKSPHLKFMGRGRGDDGLYGITIKLLQPWFCTLRETSRPSSSPRNIPQYCWYSRVQMCIPLAPMHYNHLGLQIRLVDAFSSFVLVCCLVLVDEMDTKLCQSSKLLLFPSTKSSKHYRLEYIDGQTWLRNTLIVITFSYTTQNSSFNKILYYNLIWCIDLIVCFN